MAAPVLVAARGPRSRARRRGPSAVVKAVAHGDQIAGDEREQVARLRVRVDPARPVPPVAQPRPRRPDCRWTAAPGSARAIGDDGGGVARHHVRPVGKEGDAAEALGLALGEEVAAGGVEAGQLGVLLRRDLASRSATGTVRHRRRSPARARPSGRSGIQQRPSSEIVRSRSASPSSRSGAPGCPAGLRRTSSARAPRSSRDRARRSDRPYRSGSRAGGSRGGAPAPGQRCPCARICGGSGAQGRAR